jgi:hypothetical protein
MSNSPDLNSLDEHFFIVCTLVNRLDTGVRAACKFYDKAHSWLPTLRACDMQRVTKKDVH